MMFMFYKTSSNGNILFFILLSIVLLGLVTAAILQTSKSNRNDIDDETLRVHLSEVQQYANELERGIKIIMQNPISEYDIRFAHPDASPDYGDYSALSATPNILVFHPKGVALPINPHLKGSMMAVHGNLLPQQPCHKWAVIVRI